jgi:opacity protein-like surface antigen
MKKLFLAMVLLAAVMGPALFAQERTPVKLPSDLRSAFGKGIKCTVTAPNILQVSGNRMDLDAIRIRDVPYNGQKTIIIKIRSFEGKFRWDHGKMFGLTLADPNNAKGYIDPDPASGKKTMDKLIDGPFTVGEELVFALPDDVTSKPGTLNFVLAVYAGATFELELWFN